MNFPLRRIEQAAEHFDRGRFARAVGAQQAVNFAVMDLQMEVLDGRERAELLGQMVGADGDLSSQFLVAVAGREGSLVHFLAEASERRDERIFQRRIVHANFADGDARGLHLFVHECCARSGSCASKSRRSPKRCTSK